jgi:16S rRNA (guanine966-N2)-methyltransferase
MATKQHHFRIIGGKWRARQLPISDHLAVRPTPNRVRETLFNWLMHDIHGAVCLDAFAGSGALGIEALSRGAEKVYFIEKEKAVLEQLEKNLSLLKKSVIPANVGIQESRRDSSLTSLDPSVRWDDNTYNVVLGNMPETLDCLAPLAITGIDIVFLDPPFHQNLILPSLEALEKSNLLKPSSLVYLEIEREFNLVDQLDPRWQVLKNKQTGKVGYYLLSLKKN